jgi:hypothetical protein
MKVLSAVGCWESNEGGPENQTQVELYQKEVPLYMTSAILSTVTAVLTGRCQAMRLPCVLMLIQEMPCCCCCWCAVTSLVLAFQFTQDSYPHE